MKCRIEGPFNLPTKGDDRLHIETDSRLLNDWWDREVDDKAPVLSDRPLSSACGCYIFSIRVGGGAPVPWYVGKAAKQALRDECFKQGKIVHYDRALLESWEARKKNRSIDTIRRLKRGTPQLFLLPAITDAEKPRYRIPGPSAVTDVSALEELLMGMAIERNSELRNKANLQFLRNLEIVGFYHSNKGGKTKTFREMLGRE